MMNHKQDLKWYIIFLAPALLIYVSFVWFPTFSAFYQSLFRWKGVFNKTFVGFKNYRYLLTDRTFRNSLWVTVKYMLINVPIQIPSAYLIAYLLFSIGKGQKLFRFLYFVPVVLLTVSVSFLFNMIFSRAMGVFQPICDLFGVKYRNPLSVKESALITVILIDWWKHLGTKIMLFYAAFQNIPQDVIDAAHIDGAGKATIFVRMIVPLTWGIITMVITLLVIGSLKAFDMLYALTGGGPNHATDVITIHLIDTAFGEMNWGGGNAIAVIMFVLSLLLTLITRTALNRRGQSFF